MHKDHLQHIILKDIGFSLLTEGKIIKVKADGYSMYPSIKPGSVIYIEPIPDGSSLLPGEILAWKREEGLIVHRLERIINNENDTEFVTKGDSCINEDKPVILKQIAGRVIKVEGASGKIKLPVNKRIGKPAHVYNRLVVWTLIRIKRIMR